MTAQFEVTEHESPARDVYPAEVLMPDGSVLTKCRVFITSHRMLVYRSDAQRTVSLAAYVALAEPGQIAPDRSTLQGRLEVRGSEVMLEDGAATAGDTQTWWINRGRGCTCRTAELTALTPPVEAARRR